MKIESNTEVIVGNDKKDVTVEKLVSLDEETNELGIDFARRAVQKFLRDCEEYNSHQARKRIADVNEGQEPEKRKKRVPEARLQNTLLGIIYRNKLPLENAKHWVKVAFSKEEKEKSFKNQLSVEKFFAGIQSCVEAIKSLKEDDKNNWFATNDHLDAEFKIDILAGKKDDQENIKIINFVQVKSSLNKLEVDEIHKTHQEYLNNLPKLIGPLNINEAKRDTASFARHKSEILDFDRSLDSTQLTLFGLVLDDYLDKINHEKNINAKEFYKHFVKEGGILNPFTVIGILKKSKKMKEYKEQGYFTGNEKYEKVLSETAHLIPFTEEESVAYHEEHHAGTLFRDIQVFSIIMVRGEIISRKELKTPYES